MVRIFLKYAIIYIIIFDIPYHDFDTLKRIKGGTNQSEHKKLQTRAIYGKSSEKGKVCPETKGDYIESNCPRASSS